MKRSRLKDKNGKRIHEGDWLLFDEQDRWRLIRIHPPPVGTEEERWDVENTEGKIVTNHYVNQLACTKWWTIYTAEEDAFTRLWQ